MTGSSPRGEQSDRSLSGMTVAVLAGTGQTAERVVAAIRRTGTRVITISRRAPDAGSDARVADLEDVVGLTLALDGVEAVYLVPPRLHPREDHLMGQALEAARRAGVGRVVFHSVLHPHQPDMPHHMRKLQAELSVRRSGIPWTILEPASYAQNVLRRLVRTNGRLLLPSGWSPDSPGMAVVDLEDVADVAAKVMLRDADIEATYELAGPQRLTLTQMSAVLAAHYGEPVRAVERDPDMFTRMGAPELERLDSRAYHQAYGRHGVPGNAQTLAALLERPPATFADVVRREAPTV